MVFLAVLVAPLLMLLATVAEQRRGGAAAGWVAALPVSLAVAAAAITLDAGAHPAAAVVLAAAQHVPAQVVFAVVAGRRLLAGRPIADSLVVGLLGYVVASVLLVDLDRAVAPAVAVAALVVAPRLLGTGEVRATAPTSRRWTAVGCAACATVVLAAVGLSRLAGPGIAGAAAAFPTMTSALVLSVAVRAGGDAAASVLVGLVRSLPCYLAFCLVLGALLLTLPAVAFPAALAATIGVGVISWGDLARGPNATLTST